MYGVDFKVTSTSDSTSNYSDRRYSSADFGRMKRIQRMMILTVVLLLLLTDSVRSNIIAEKRFPIVYVFTVTAQSCKRGLPEYIIVSLRQAVLSQPDCDVVMASNYASCPTIESTVDSIPNVIKHDINFKASERSALFANVSEKMFEANFNGDLWITSAQRFFSMEDYMINTGHTEMLHVEADNMLYGKVNYLLHFTFFSCLIRCFRN